MQRLVEPASDPPPADRPRGWRGRLSRLGLASGGRASGGRASDRLPRRRRLHLPRFRGQTRLGRYNEPVRVPGLARPVRIPGGFSSSQAAALLALVAGTFLVTATLVVVRHSGRLYLSADAGHYLADADALFGHGVRESRHLPVFPVLLGLLRLLTDDLGAVVLAMAVVVLVMASGFYVFIRGRLGAPLAEMVGVVSFVLAPVIAEGVAWYGASMMLGLGLSLFAMRLVERVVDKPTPGRVLAAGGLCGLVGLTHPLAFVLLAEVCTLVAVASIGPPLLKALRKGLKAGRIGLRAAGRDALPLAAVGVVALAVVAPAASFYTSLQTPVTVAFNPARLASLPDWAFREDPWLWVPLLIGGLLVLIPGGRALNGRTGLRLGMWGAAVGVVSVGNLLLGGGHESYTTRYAYALPVTVGCTVAVVIGLLSRLPETAGPRARRAVGALVAVAVVALCLQAGHSYFQRLSVAVPYYNLITDDEMEGIRWLDSRPGTVAVSAKGGDKVAGSLYAWMIEGLAHVHALGTAEGYVNLLEEAHAESTDVERLMAGSVVLESGSLRLSASEGTAAPVEVQGRIGGDWFPLVTLAVGPERVGSPLVPEVQADASDDRGTLQVDYGSLEVRAAMSATGEDGELAIDVVRVGEPDAVSVEVDPPPFAIGVALQADGDGGTLSRKVRDEQVDVRLEADPPTRAQVEEDVRSGTSRLHLEGGNDGVRLRVNVHGLDKETGRITLLRQADILERRDFRYVYTWRATGLPPILASRRCFSQAMANDEVVVFEVLPECQAGGAGGADGIGGAGGTGGAGGR
ncbi:MAG: hypothetical protein QOD63_1898 [Actinomycetota bacterium]|nr:hypothetical protein [Actinomycetota bacterium]